MKLEGDFIVAAPRADVWTNITDPTLMADCIPGCEQIEIISATRYRAIVKVVVGPIKASFNLMVDVIREEAPERIYSVTRGEEGTRASIVSAENLLILSERGDGTTQVSYASDVSVTGRLGKFGLGVMRKKAEALSQDFAGSFRQRVEQSTADGLLK